MSLSEVLYNTPHTYVYASLFIFVMFIVNSLLRMHGFLLGVHTKESNLTPKNIYIALSILSLKKNFSSRKYHLDPKLYTKLFFRILMSVYTKIQIFPRLLFEAPERVIVAPWIQRNTLFDNHIGILLEAKLLDNCMRLSIGKCFVLFQELQIKWWYWNVKPSVFA